VADRVQIKVGTVGAKECGDYEEWFNYRVARAAPETCADFLGSFVADKTKSEFVKGGKWLVWKFEVRIWAIGVAINSTVFSLSLSSQIFLLRVQNF
jgi:hypothetical protein